MADFTWDDIEDAATEKTKTSSDAEKPEPQEAKGDFTWDDVEDTLVASASTPEQPNPPAARRWEDGDGESATVPEGYVNHWGGNLRVGGRKPYIRRDEQGKVAGYSSGESAVTVRGEDGKFAVVPLVADGKALSIDEAIERYKKTGEHWGRADSEEGARKILDEVGMANKARDQKDWIEYVQAHWDEMGDAIKSDKDAAREHKYRENMGGKRFEPNVPKTAVLTPEEAKAKDKVEIAEGEDEYETVYDNMGLPIGRQKKSEASKLGASDVAKLEYEAATGVEAPDHPLYAHLANMGLSVGGKLNANLQMFAAQELAKGGERTDGQTDALFNKMIFGIGKYASFFLPSHALDEWDETIGSGIKDPAERTRARNEFADDMARQFIAERSLVKQNAATELGNREIGHAAVIFGRGPAQIGYSLPYALGPVGIALQFAEESAANAVGYMNDEYAFAPDGTMVLGSEGDTAGRAILAGAGTAGIETMTEVVGGKVGGAVLERGGKVLAKPIGEILKAGGKVLVGKFSVLKTTGGKIAKSAVGESAEKFGKSLKNLTKWTSKKLHLESYPEENLEEWESATLNALTGWDMRESELNELRNAETGERLSSAERFVKAQKEFFSPKNLIELNEAMFLTMGGGAGVAYFAQRGAMKQVDSFLESKGLMTSDEVKKADLQTKAQAIDAYNHKLTEEQVRQKLDTATGICDALSRKIDNFADWIRGESGDQAGKVITLKRFFDEMDEFNKLDGMAKEALGKPNATGEQYKEFKVQMETGADGKPVPKFSTALVVNPRDGESVQQKQMHDGETGVTIKDTDGVYSVESDVIPGLKFTTASLGRALATANNVAIINQQRKSERSMKAQALDGILNDEMFAGRNFAVVETGEQAMRGFGGDPNANPFAPGFTTTDGTTVLILDNLDNPAEAIAALDVGTPNDRGAFADGVEFKTESDKNEFGDVVEMRVARDRVHDAAIIDNGDGTFAAWPAKGDPVDVKSVEEAVAVVNGKQATATPKQETPNEAVNGTDEAPARSEQGAAGKPQAPEAAQPGAPEQQGTEAPRAGVVEKPAAYNEAKNRPAQTDDGRPKSPFAAGRGEGSTKAYFDSRLKEMGVDRATASDEQLKQINDEIKEIEKPYEEAVKQWYDSLPDGTRVLPVVDETGEGEMGMGIQKVNGKWYALDSAGNVTGRLANKINTPSPERGKVILPSSSSAENRAEAPAKPAGARPATETSEITPKAEKPVEATSDATTQELAASSSPAVTPEPAPKTTTTAKTPEPAKPDTADLEKMIAAADPDLESARSMDDEDAFRKALDGKNLSPEDRNKFLDRFYETHPAAASRARVAAKKTLRSKLADKASKDFAQHILDKYAPDGQTVKAKRDASRAATMEKANAVPAPGFLGKKTGTAQGLIDYLADKAHNRASLHKAIQSVRDHVKKFGSLGFSKADKAKVSAAIDAAQKRLGKMTEEFRKGFGEQGADIPKDRLAKYLDRANKENSLLGFWLEKGRLLVRPRSAKAAKAAVGVKNALVDRKFDGHLFDPDAEGADALNSFFDGMKGQERAKWLRILFGRGTSEVTTRSDGSGSNDEVVAEINNWVRGDYGNENDGAAERYSLGDIGRILADFAAEMEEFVEFLRTNETAEERAQREQYEYEQQEEQKVLDAEFGPIDDYRIAELEARGMADLQYANAKAFVENRADERDVAMLTPSALAKAEEGDKIRLDHHKQTFDFLSYDAENGILYVEDRVEVQTDEGEYLAPRVVRFRVTEDGISEIKEETNDTGTETGTPGNLAPDEKGAATGGSREEGEGGASAPVGDQREGKDTAVRRPIESGQVGRGDALGLGGAAGAGAASIRQRDGRADGRSDVRGVSGEAEAAEVRRLYRALADSEYAAAHPEELKEALALLKKGVSISAVANLPLTETDKATWPLVATRINTREDAANLGRILSRPSIEIGKVLYLDKDGNILRADIHSVGFVGQTRIDEKQIRERAPAGTYGVVFMHNHPSEQGDKVKPSPQDLLCSKDMREELNKYGIKLLDHIITDHTAFYSMVGRDYVNSHGDEFQLVSPEAEEFWARNEARGNSVEKPADKMNIVPFAERVSLVNVSTSAYIKSLARQYAKVNKTDSYVVGIDAKGHVVYVSKVPDVVTKESAERFFTENNTAMRFFMLLGSRPFDKRVFLNGAGVLWNGRTKETAPSVVHAYSISGDKLLSGELWDQGYRNINAFFANWSDAEAFLPDKDAGGGGSAASAAATAPRLPNAPKLDGDAQRDGLDILDELGGMLNAPVHPPGNANPGGDTSASGAETQQIDGSLRAPVEPLDREQFEKLRAVAIKLMDHLAAHGYNTFDDMVRYVAANRPDLYERLKDPLRRAWNSSPRVVDEADEITIARGRQIFGKIDTELQEASHDSARNGQDRAEGRGGERDQAPGDNAVAGGAGVRDGGPQAVRVPGRGRPVADNVDGRGPDVGDAGVDGEGQGAGASRGVGGDADRQRAGVGPGAVSDGDAQRDSEGPVQELNEVTPGFSEYEPPADLPVKAPKSQSLIVESSALASITPPKIETKPEIPDSIPKDGILQAHQYHAVCQVVNAHNEKLPNGQRRGYLCGDGTGAGKTRIIAGVMLDAVNRNLGNGKALIISKDGDLLAGAKSDFKPFGIADKLFELNDKGRKQMAQGGKGIAFTTYASLAQNFSGVDAEGRVMSAGKRGKADNRFAEIVKWLGKDFDGVIALDEAHSAAKGDLASLRAQATRAQAVIDLQNALPNARVLYLTATAAYDANHLKFLTRLGLWGEGTGFDSLTDFANAVNQGGLSMMEILTQGLKAKGLYCSRSISFKGVKCNRVVARLTPEQKETYSRYSNVLSRIHDAALQVGEIVGVDAKQQARQYFGRMLDLFNSLITSMKVQKAIELGRAAIAEGKSPVFQLISTNESARDAKSAKQPKKQVFDLFGNVIGEEQSDEVEVGVKDRIIAYLNGGGFPVRENLGKVNGVQQWGEEIPEAVALRDEMIALVESLPNVANPIDELTKAFADVGISRITGKSDKNAEANKFNNGDNLALVFSGAGGTGASYHADKRFKNQRQRVQIPIEFGWEPEKFLQALGRSHRNNQVVPPEFVLLTTDIAGEMRFMSTIANRVASMGAIVGGDRNSSGQVVSAADSVDTIYGRAAIRDAIRKLASGQRIGEMPGQEVFAAMFLNPDKADEIEPTKFLGRMQFLPVDEQSAIYSEIADRIERAVAKAKADGTYDDGIRKITAKRVEVKDTLDVSARNTGASLLTVGETYDSTRIDHNALEARAPEGVTVEYMRNKRSGRLYALLPNGQNFVRLAPDGSYETVLPLERGNYERVGADAARKEWDEEYAKLPAEVERVRHYMSGDLIPLWDVIGVEGRPFVYRAQPQGAKPFIGLYISNAQMPVTLFGFGLKDKARKLFAESAYRLVAREGARLGIGAAGDPDVSQPYFKKMKIGTRYVLAVVHAEGSPVAADLTGNGWDKAWAKDETNSYDRGGDVYYRDFDDAAEAVMKEIFKKHGAVIYHGRKAVFESKDGLAAQTPVASSPERGETSARPAPNPSGATLGERVGMPEMRMCLENGQVIITNTKPVKALLNNMKLAFGGEWANRVRDGKRYVKSDLKWNPDPSGRGGFWSIPLDKVPPEIRSEIEGSGELRSTVVPIGSADELEREGGLVRLAQNPVELKTTFVHNMLRAGITPLEDSRLVAISDAELVRRAADEGDMTALGELYKRYMGENAKNGGLRGLIRRAAARKGMTGVLTAERIEEVASLVWAGVASDGAHYEQRRNGVVADFASGNVEIYRNAKSLIPAMSAKIDQVLNDMAERSKKRPELLTLDKPSRAREGESELDQQMADNPSVADATVGGEIADETAAAGEIAVDDGTPEGALARKVGGFANMLGRRLTPEERSRLNAMDVLEETMFFLPDELQDVINAVLAEERKRGFTDKGAKRVAPESMSAAQAASGLSPRVFGYRYRTAKELLNEIWNNIKSGKADENIAIKAREIEGLEETDEEINEDILDSLDISADTRRVLQLLLDGEAVSDIAEAFKLPPALIRAWKARARNEYGLVFPADANDNSLGLDLGEPNKTERKARAPRAKREASGVKMWTPDLFAAADATVGDVQAEKISAGIAAGASDEQIAREADVALEIVKLARIREKEVDESPVVAPGASVAGTRYVREENRFNNETGHFEKVRVAVKTDGTTEVLGPAAKPQGETAQGTLFAPVTPLEQGTRGINSVAAEPPLGYANAAVNEWRSEHGYSEIAKKAKVSLDDLNRLGAAMANNVREMERMVERLSRAPYAVSPVEQVALGQYIVAQERKFNALHAQKQEAFANGNETLAASIDLEAQEVFAKLDAAQRINARVVGNQLGLAMRARQLTLNEDGSIADYMISCARANGGPLTKAQREQAEKLFAQLAKADVELDDATTAALVEYLDAVSKRRLAAQLDEVKERKAAKREREIERDYREALLQIRYHGEKRSGGTLHGLPGGQKWIRALEAYHLLNGEGLTDGKPDAAKMVELVLKDIHDQGVEASAWDVRQMESRMGNLIRPSQDEISKSLRDLHTQMLLVQQTEHMLKTGEMPPKTGFDRDEDSAAVRFLRRERERVMRKLGIDRKTADEMLKTALDSYKTRTRNQIEELERAIADVEAGKPYEKDERRKLQLDDEAQALKDRRDALKERLAALTHDPAKEETKRMERAIAAVAKAIAVRKEQIAAIEAGTYDFDAKRGEKASTPQLDQMRAELKALTKERDELKKALYPYGTEAEILRRLTLRDKTTQKSLDRWSGMAAEYQAAKSWEDRAKAVAPTERRKDIVDIESDSPEVKAKQEVIRAKQKLRDQARAKVAEFRNQLKRDDTRGAGVSAWAKFLTSAPVMLRTMLDMSVGMVQGGRFMLAHPVKWAKVTFKASKAFLGHGWADELAKEIKDDPYFEDFKKHGGHLYNLEGLDSDTPEDFRALESGAPLPGGKTLSLENIPGVRRSARSFSGFLNKAGLELYRAMVESCGPDGAGATDNVKKDIARFVNTALGYGYSKTSDEKGLLRAIAGIADAMAWAPRKAVAEIKYATGYDLFFEPWLGTRKHEKSGAEIRQSMKAIGRQKLRHVLGGVAFGLCMLLLAKAVNGDDDDDKNRMSDILDPRSPDFGRVRIGNTSYSVFGDEMVWRLIGRLVAGQTKANGVVIEKNRQDILVQYARGKANPLLGLAWDLATGKDFTGGKVEDKSIGKLVRDYTIPLTWSAEYENFAMNDPLTAIVNAIPVFLGGAKSTYERDPLERVAKQGDEAKRRMEAAVEAGDAATAQRIGEKLSERGEVYGAAKDVEKLQKEIKKLEAKAKMYKYTIDHSKDGGSQELQKDYADTVKAVEKLQGQLEGARKAATETYRKAKGKGQKWDDMSWTE